MIKNLGTIFSNILDNESRRRGFYEPFLISSWSKIVGQDIALMYTPMRISHINVKKKVFWLWPTSKKAEFEFQYLKKQIIDSINRYFGYNMIDEIKIISNIEISN